jgi:vacuolar-type H+-ATPase subunit E/Vma4
VTVALAELLAALEREAAAEITAVAERARAEVEGLRAEAARRRDDRLRTDTAAHRVAVQADADSRLADAERAAAREVLAERAAMLARLRAAVVERLPAAAAGMVEPLVAMALAPLRGSDVTLRCPAALAAAVRACVGAGPRIDPEGATGSGVRAELEDGHLVVDATLETMLARAWGRLQIEATREVEREDR